MQTSACLQALEALVDTAFLARFDLDRITKERSAVVAEAQMMNTMEYRVDCALLRSLHRECSLGSRFPIGRVEQVCIGHLWGPHHQRWRLDRFCPWRFSVHAKHHRTPASPASQTMSESNLELHRPCLP